MGRWASKRPPNRQIQKHDNQITEKIMKEKWALQREGGLGLHGQIGSKHGTICGDMEIAANIFTVIFTQNGLVQDWALHSRHGHHTKMRAPTHFMVRHTAPIDTNKDGADLECFDSSPRRPLLSLEWGVAVCPSTVTVAQLRFALSLRTVYFAGSWLDCWHSQRNDLLSASSSLRTSSISLIVVSSTGQKSRS